MAGMPVSHIFYNGPVMTD